MAAGRRGALLPIAALLCLSSAAASLPRDASPLRSLRTEEGNIDDLIAKIEQLQQQQRQQEPISRHVEPPARPAAGHPPRQFAYYPSDPEYRAPRPPADVTVQGAGSGQRHAATGHAQAGLNTAAKTGHAQPAAVTAPAPATRVTSADPPVTRRDRGDPEEVIHEPDRHKKSSSDADDTRVLKVRADALLSPAPSRDNASDIYFIVTVAGICAMAVGVTVAGGFCYHRLQKRAKAAGDAEYPAYGVTGPSRDLSPSGDRKLAQSAQMYHYQHQKQQMMAMEKTHNGRHGSASDVDSEEENEEGDYTVYECPGLAPTGEMEVKNPLFQDDQTPAPAASSEANNGK